MTTNSSNRSKRAIRSELESARSQFHALLNSLSADDVQRQSMNPGWTNREILFHMAFAFMLIPRLIFIVRLFGKLPDHYSRWFANLLNNSTGFFNWINAFGARGGGKISTRKGLGQKFDNTLNSILEVLDSIPDEEMKLGMHYPSKWDQLFSEYMTLEEIFYYPIRHFRFHIKQIAR